MCQHRLSSTCVGIGMQAIYFLILNLWIFTVIFFYENNKQYTLHIPNSKSSAWSVLVLKGHGIKQARIQQSTNT